MSASIKVVVQSVDGALNVPSAALGRGGGGQTVTVVKNGKTSAVPVLVGLRGDTSDEILSGVSAGEQVQIAAPSFSTSTSSSTAAATGAGTGRLGGGLGGAAGGLGGGLGGGGLGGGGGGAGGGGFGGARALAGGGG
jgi:hypothetical protein